MHIQLQDMIEANGTVAFLKKYMNDFNDLELGKLMKLYRFKAPFGLRTVKVSDEIKDKILKTEDEFKFNSRIFRSFEKYASKNNMMDYLKNLEETKQE